MIDAKIRKALQKIISGPKAKTIEIGPLFKAARANALDQDSDMAVLKILLKILQQLAEEGEIKLPSQKGEGWDRNKTGLPHYVTRIDREKEAQKKANREEIEEIRNNTSWEPKMMIPIVHSRPGLTKVEDYRKAAAVNDYLIQKSTDQPKVPVRERSLQIFGDEKFLDSCSKKDLFSGRISLEDLDCFYYPEPLAFHPLSMDLGEIKGKPLLVVENSNTYRSCWQANAITKTFAAVVYGKGYKAAAKSMEEDGLLSIETQLESCGIWYFGDLDPDGLEIPKIINKNREKLGLSSLLAGIPLYKALMRKGLLVLYENSQEKKHDKKWAIQWLGKELAQTYLDQVDCVRWPQEGLGERDLIPIFSELFPLKKER
ncbi:MAG: hypothetical protein GY737_12965 [Desulfobacteraceae bacterium]|nr:hypothetical protein [Desulfobacteraceae bacterium]